MLVAILKTHAKKLIAKLKTWYWVSVLCGTTVTNFRVIFSTQQKSLAAFLNKILQVNM